MYSKPLLLSSTLKTQPRYSWLVVLAALLFSQVVVVHAQPQPQPHTQASKAAPAIAPKGKLDSGAIIKQDPLSGIVINRTMTVLGWDFYKDFTNIWRAVHPDSQYTLTITERPTAKYGSEIWITYTGHQVFHTFMSPTRSQVKEVTRQAAQTVYQTITRYQQQLKLYGSKDLAPKEM